MVCWALMAHQVDLLTDQLTDNIHLKLSETLLCSQIVT